MENIAVIIFTIFMFSIIISAILLVIGLIKKDFKFKPSKKIIGICIGGCVVSLFFYGAVQTPETKARIEAENKAKEEKEALEKAEKEALKLKEEEEKADKEQKDKQEKEKADKEALAKEEQNEKEQKDKQEKEALAKKEKEDVEKKRKDEDINTFGKVIEKPVMNGTKTEKIGIYAEVMVGKAEINKENLVQFYKNIVKDSNYNWVTLNIDGKTGIQFPGSNFAFTYGTIDSEGCIIKSEGHGFISGDSIEYE